MTDRSRPDLDDATVAALGTLSESLETIEQARGLLQRFHQITGKADLLVQDAVAGLRDAGHTELAGGDRHVHEARMKQGERTSGHPRHAAGPALHD